MKLKKKSLLPLSLILILFILLGLDCVCAFTTTVYKDQFTGVNINAIQSYSDGTALLTLSYTDPSRKGILVVRLIHPDGSVIAFEMSLRCDGSGNCPAILYPLGSNYIFVTYKKTEFNVDENTYGIVVDWTGNIITSDISLGLTDIQVSSSLSTAFQPNIDPNVNFLWTNAYKYKNANQISWILFSAPNANGSIDMLSQGTFQISNSTVLMDYKTFSTIEGGFGLAYLTKEPILIPDPRNSLILSSKPQWYIFVTFMQPGSADFSEPTLIYQTSIPFYSIQMNSCFAAKDASGYGCIYFTPMPNGYDYMFISFLSSGSVSIIEQIVDANVTKVEEVMGVTPLPFGGFLSVTVDVSTGDTNFIGHVSQSNGIIETNISLPTQSTKFYGVFPNNTLYVLSSNNDGLTIYMEPLPKFLQEDNGFGNLLIDSVNPPLLSNIGPNLRDLTITFRQDVLLSFKNVSIYQYTTKNPLLRQTFTAQSQYCSLFNDNRTISLQVLSSTFNSPRSSYFVMMNNNFVSSKSQNQPLTGVSEGYWTYTADTATGIFTATSTGLLRLTPEGSIFFNNLDKVDKANFFNEILLELSEIIPINIKRLSTSKRHQPDPKATYQILFPVTIESVNDLSERTVQQVIDDLNILIKNKGISPISFRPFTSYLDSTYGFQPTPNLWEIYKLKLIYVAIVIVILCAIYFVARRKNREGKNFVIVKVTLMLVDLILDIAFVVTSGNDVKGLLLPSILCLTIPIGFNSLVAFILLISEISTNKKFYGWFQAHSKPAAFLTILASTDVEAITLMSSELFGLQIFSAPLSKRSEIWIFWAGFCNIFIEDAPQLIIQILYRRLTVSYDIIPLLTLIMSSILLIINVIGHTYDGIHKCFGHNSNLIPNEKAKKDELE
ncbi:14616_t:CDS:10 [Funneliformis geosporum]|uniref:18396_t:CDS:1 n=1 Tax=Funneliformis geosporum TaxID=1117311 RepID=A0A9W4SQ44_9GLOM|nr:14616_t:CDS:10 [Funneliformis geosporum]CAI2177542.1 18396_t:CDS:10 [Funneliformis geosporum]